MMTDTTTINDISTESKVDPNGIIARIMLAFLTTAGIFYINIMPAVVNGLKEGLAFTNQQAGFVSSANLYGAAIGALAAVFLIKRINWRSWSYVLLISLIFIDSACLFIESPIVMIAVRFLHGLVGGALSRYWFLYNLQNYRTRQNLWLFIVYSMGVRWFGAYVFT
jgi:MFS family permease